MPPDQKNPVIMRAASTGQLASSASTPKAAPLPNHSKDELTLLSSQSVPSPTSSQPAPQSLLTGPWMTAPLNPDSSMSPHIPPSSTNALHSSSVDDNHHQVEQSFKPPWTAIAPIALQAAVPISAIASPPTSTDLTFDSPSPVLVERSLSEHQAPPQVAISQQPILNENHFTNASGSQNVKSEKLHEAENQ